MNTTQSCCQPRTGFSLPMATRSLMPLRKVVLLVAVAFLVCPLSAEDQAVDYLRTTSKAFAAVAKKASPAVVFVKVEKVLARGPGLGRSTPYNDPFDLFNDEFLRRFFGDRLPERQAPPEEYRQMGQGSGFIVSADGYILTNNHVVGDADKVTVKLHDGREFEAKLVGADPHTDVAVVKIDAVNLPVLPLGDSDRLEVGEWVLAVGNPFGLSHTLTAGIVSAKGRSAVGIADYEDFIQTDAAINPGNSGGPLINLEGKAVGINTAIFSRSGGYMGIGFAIPINMAKSIRDQLINKGSVTRGFLGIVIQNLTPELAETFGVKDTRGIVVSDVTKDSPAEKAGLKRGDVITECDGEPVTEVGPFRNRIALTAPGASVRLDVLRDGKRKSLTVKLGELPSSDELASAHSDTLKELGLSVQGLTPEIAQRLGYQGESGVVVSQVDPGSVAALAGIRPGTLIQEVNRTTVRSPEEFRNAVETASDGTVLLLVRDGKFSRYVALKVPR